jgi:hypothetical protein
MKYTVDDNILLKPNNFIDDPGFEQWSKFSFAKKMIEIFGEAARLTKFIDNHFADKDIEFQWNSFNRLCMMTFADANTSIGEKQELYYAYLDIKDYTFSDNPMYKERSIVMKWFKQWMNDEHLMIAGVI